MVLIILHAGELDGSLYAWGETPEGRTYYGGKIPAYKYGAGRSHLIGALKEAGIGQEMPRPMAVSAWLPAIRGEPVPSSRLVAEYPPPNGEPEVSGWAVLAVRLSAPEAMTLLGASDKRTIAPGVLAGADLGYWAGAMRLAGSLVARQRFLPGVTQASGKPRASWLPLFTGRDAQRLGGLARCMPSSGRALASPDLDRAPDSPPALVLERVISGMVDYMVRAAPGKTGILRRRRKIFDSVHDAWLNGLVTKSGSMSYEKNDISNLESQIAEWRRPVEVANRAPFRLCFRLEEPEEADDGDAIEEPNSDWFVRYLLQPYKDPSMLIPASKVWGGFRIIGCDDSRAREFLLLSLGQAAALSPAISAGAQDQMAGHALDAAGAYRFLTQEADALAQAGYGVMLPSWWTGKGTKARLSVRATVRSAATGTGTFTLDDVLGFNYEAAMGGQGISIEELERLAQLKSPLIRFRGRWVEADTEQIKAAVEFLKRKGGMGTLQDVIRMARDPEGVKDGIRVEVGATGQLAQILGGLDTGEPPVEIEPPEGFEGTLRPYQIRGYRWLAFLQGLGLGGCLADDMGLGKTVQALACVRNDWKGAGTGPVLLICPTSIINNWQREAARFAPGLPVMVHHGADRRRGKGFAGQAAQSAIVLSSYGLLQRDAKLLSGVEWRGVILDEAQNIKNPDTKQASAARNLKAGYRFALTGTPVENTVGELWSIMEFLNPGLLGTRASFRRDFLLPIQAEGSSAAAARLKGLASPFMMRRLKTDKSVIPDLPEKMEMNVVCPLTREQTSLYAAIVRETARQIYDSEGIQRRGIVLATLTRLKQVCNHPAHYLGDNSAIPARSGKLDRLTEMLEEIIEVGERALIFTQFAEMGHMLQRHIQERFGREAPFLHGGVPRARRDDMVEQFQKDGGPPVFILTLKAGGTGLNLTAANHVFHFDRWWNPAVENQATDRAFRIGQKQNVQVRKLVCAGTLEEKIDQMIRRKKRLAEEVVGSGEGWLTELSNEELRSLISLEEGA